MAIPEYTGGGQQLSLPTELFYRQLNQSLAEGDNSIVVLSGLAGSGKTTFSTEILDHVQAVDPNIPRYYLSLGQGYNLARSWGMMPKDQSLCQPEDLHLGSQIIQTLFEYSFTELPRPAFYLFDSVATTGVLGLDGIIGTDRGLSTSEYLLSQPSARGAVLVASKQIREHAANERGSNGVVAAATPATMAQNDLELMQTMGQLSLPDWGEKDLLDRLFEDYYPYWMDQFKQSGIYSPIFLYQNQYRPGINTDESILATVGLLEALAKRTPYLKEVTSEFRYTS